MKGRGTIAWLLQSCSNIKNALFPIICIKKVSQTSPWIGVRYLRNCNVQIPQTDSELTRVKLSADSCDPPSSTAFEMAICVVPPVVIGI
jgi:hypothetical protein